MGLKVVGAGHSFSAIALSYNHTENATMLSLDNMASVVRVEDRPDGTCIFECPSIGELCGLITDYHCLYRFTQYASGSLTVHLSLGDLKE